MANRWFCGNDVPGRRRGQSSIPVPMRKCCDVVVGEHFARPDVAAAKASSAIDDPLGFDGDEFESRTSRVGQTLNYVLLAHL